MATDRVRVGAERSVQRVATVHAHKMVSSAVMPPSPHLSTGCRPAKFPTEVSYRIEREKPHEGPNPDAEKVLRQQYRADDRTRGQYQPKGPCKHDRSAGAGDPIPGRQPTVIARSATPVCGRPPRCSSGQRELEEDETPSRQAAATPTLVSGTR